METKQEEKLTSSFSHERHVTICSPAANVPEERGMDRGEEMEGREGST